MVSRMVPQGSGKQSLGEKAKKIVFRGFARIIDNPALKQIINHIIEILTILYSQLCNFKGGGGHP